MSGALATVSADLDVSHLPSVKRESNALWQFAGDAEVPVGLPSAVPARIPVIYPIWRLGNQQLARPMVVTVEIEAGSLVMNSPKLRIWGVGVDVYEALADFSVTFFDVLESYRQTEENQLSPGALEYRQQLESYVS